MKKTPFQKTTGVIVVPTKNLNFGQTVDVLNEISIPEPTFAIKASGEKTILLVPKNCVQLYDTIYDFPCVLNPRFADGI